jgi:transcriptional regulator with XRE-family HTH domain
MKPMDPEKRKRLEAAGWQFGDAEDFLELTPTERRLVDLGVKLAQAVRRLRRAAGLTQKQAAKRSGTSQPRIVDVEAGVATLDLMFRVYFDLGGELANLDALGLPLSAEERAERVTPPRAKKSKAEATAGEPTPRRARAAKTTAKSVSAKAKS